MADPSKPDDPTPSSGPGDSKSRDFGDSAGYGSGGSAIDRRDVGAEAPEERRRPNPLDKVMDTGDGDEPVPLPRGEG